MGWKPIRAMPEFDHNQTKYPAARHARIGDLHPVPYQTGVFQRGKRCADCHADIHKRQLGANCEQCHTVKGWKVTVTADSAAPEPLPANGSARRGGLRLLPQERRRSASYKTMSTECYSCHASDYQAPRRIPNHLPTSSPPPANSATASTTGSTPNLITPALDFPLTGAHTGAATPVRGLPRQQQLQHHQHDVRVVPPEGFQRSDQSQSRSTGVCSDLPIVPHHVGLAACAVRPLEIRVPADRLAHGAAAAVRGLPRQQQLQHHQHDVRVVPS